MRIQIKREDDGGDRSSPGLWTVLTSKLLAGRWIGRPVPKLPQLELEAKKNTLLYFRIRGCTVCDLIDMKVAAACHQAGVNLIIVDRYSKSDAPEDQAIYAQPGNIGSPLTHRKNTLLDGIYVTQRYRGCPCPTYRSNASSVLGGGAVVNACHALQTQINGSR